MDFTTFTTQLSLFLHHSVITSLLVAPLLLVLLDVVTGVMSSLKQGKFDLQKLPNFLSQDIVKYLAVVALVALVYYLWDSATATSIGTFIGMTGLSLSIVKSIISNVQEVFGAPVATLVGQQLAQIGLPPYIPSPVPSIIKPPVSLPPYQPLPVDLLNTQVMPAVNKANTTPPVTATTAETPSNGV